MYLAFVTFSSIILGVFMDCGPKASLHKYFMSEAHEVLAADPGMNFF